MTGLFAAGVSVLSVLRLGLGLEVTDALHGDLAEVAVATEDMPQPYRRVPPAGPAEAARSIYDPGFGLPPIPQGSRAGRFRVTLGARRPRSRPLARIPLRIYDTERRYVPRRLAVPFPSLASLLTEEESGARPASRARRVAMFPGAGYHPQGLVTGLRGRVLDASGEPVPWVRVTARHLTDDQPDGILGHAHGDDRGEFLLLLGVPSSSLVAPAGFDYQVRLIIARRPAPPVDPSGDPLAGLLVEDLPDPGGADTVSDGTIIPASHSDRFIVTAPIRLSRLVSPDLPFIFP